ncbi:MAG: DinB family protein [Candidatus Rokuibacteriota bacterium]
MTFAYYSRLSRAQQAIYRKSAGVIEVRLPRPELLQPLVEDLAAALASESRERTWEASDRLLRGLGQELGVPPVHVEVLAARPHRRWGELHGLYTAEQGRAPKIQLWMRTAKQRRVVAFRTYLRTLLHELGHHLDYTMLRLRDSLHTEGFYKRESSLFHQLVPERTAMPTVEEYAKQTVAQRLTRLERTPDELATALRGQAEAVLARRPDAKNWAPKEVVCHLRDTEELFGSRFQQITLNDEPKLLPLMPDTPDRWAEERQYLRNEVQGALAAFRRRRDETLATLKKFGPDAWQRAGIHHSRGRMTADDILTLMAWHDDNHLEQLKRGLEGKA